MHDNNSNCMQTNNKNSDNKHHDQMGRAFFGLIIIWLGILLFLENQDFFHYSEWWAYFLLGIGVIFYFEAIIRMIRPELHKNYVGKIIAGTILIAIGAGNIYELENWWPLILVAAGALIIFINFQNKDNTTINKTE